jgi:aminopeptidase N
VRLGELDDPLARALCWSACWDMTRDGEMPARDYLRLVVNNIGRETDVGVVQNLLAQCTSAVNLYGDPANREAALDTLATAALDGLTRAAPGSDHQLAWARAFLAAARSPEHVATARAILDGSRVFEGLAVDTELRWHIVLALAASGGGDDGVIAAELERDPSDKGQRHAAAARAARPLPEAKAEAWRLVVEDRTQPLALTEEVMTGFQQFGQEELLAPYAERYFDALPQVWRTHDLPEALTFGRSMYPSLVVRPDTVARTERYLAADDVPGPIRRLLLEGKDNLGRALRARTVDVAAATT